MTELQVTRTFYWSRSPGKFVNKYTGAVLVDSKGVGPAFTGSVREWYETLNEVIVDAGNEAWRVTQERPNAVFVSLDVFTMLCSSFLFRYELGIDFSKVAMNPKPVRVGQIAHLEVHYDSSLPANVCRVGRHDGSWFSALVEILDMPALT